MSIEIKVGNKQKNNKKQVGILTFHFSHNCGAVLQALALEKTIDKYADCSIIDYQPDYHASWSDYRYKYEYPPNAIKRIWANNSNKLKAVASIAFNLPSIIQDETYHRDKARTLAFERFISQNMKCSPRCKTLLDVENETKDYHALITGSDQVWNTRIVGQDFDDTYFIKTNNDNIKRFSYAASAGNGWNEDSIVAIADKIKAFDGVSVREADLKEALENRGVRCRMNIDPSLLLDQNEYNAYEEPIEISDHYVFIYAFQITSELIQSIKELKENLNCEFISYPFNGELSERVGFKVREIEPLGPATFLFLMHHADYVVTSTFHGLTFATIYRKPFICLPPEHSKSRIENYLSMFGLEEYYWQGKGPMKMGIDYSDYDKTVIDKRREAVEYIQSMCK